jgi:hypothetical protein
MADTLKPLYTGQPGTTDTLLYTAPASTTTAVRAIHVANTTGTAATITLGLRSGAALAAANHFLSALSVPANGSYDWTGNQALLTTETIRALQGTASALTVHISGIEIA